MTNHPKKQYCYSLHVTLAQFEEKGEDLDKSIMTLVVVMVFGGDDKNGRS
jgi:hypothetical protein